MGYTKNKEDAEDAYSETFDVYGMHAVRKIVLTTVQKRDNIF